MTSSTPVAAIATKDSTTTPGPTEGLIPSPLTFEATTSQAPQGTAATTNTTNTMMGVDTIPSKIASRSFGSIRSNRSRRSTRSRDSARSQYNNRIVYSTTAYYDTWMIFLLSLPILAIALWMIVLVSSSYYDHWERSPTGWILSWSLLLIVGLYMVLLPKQLNIRSNGSLGIKTFLCTFQFSNVCHVSRGTTHTTTNSRTYPTTPTGTPSYNYDYSNNHSNNDVTASSWHPPSAGGCCGPFRVHRLGTSWTSLPCILRRRRRQGDEEDQYPPPPPPTMNGGPFEYFWDVHVTPHNPTEFIQHFESVLTRLEIQRASANNNVAAVAAASAVAAATAAPPTGGGSDRSPRMVAGPPLAIGDASAYYLHTAPPQDRPPLSVVTATFV